MSDLLWQKDGVAVDARIMRFLAGDDVVLDREFFVHDISAVLHGGRQTVERNDRFFAPDYNDWAVTLRKKLAGFTGSVSYTDTDLEKEECFGGGDICDGRVVFAVQRSL